MSAELSEAARDVCARWFAGPKDTVRSHPPHKALSKVQAAVNELVAAGIVTKAEFNRFGVFEFTGSAEASLIGRERQRQSWASIFAAETEEGR